MGGKPVALAVNTVWVVLAGALVFFMEGGFALLEAGLVQTKNALSIVMKVMADVTVGSIVYALLGFGLMFGLSRAGLFGTTGYFLGPLHTGSLTVSEPVFWFFEMAFAVAAVSIVSGAVSERMRFPAYLLYVVVGILAYSVSGHWVWGPGGWLAGLGMRDFAGSAVVHAFGGFSALAAAAVLGARLGRFEPGTEFLPSNLPLAFTGTFILWFGWFGFNAGSTLSAFAPDIGQIVANTMLSAAAAGLVAVLWSRWRFDAYDPTMAINGVLAGLVAITAGCAYVPVWAGGLIGVAAGVLVVESTGWLEAWGIDDPVGAFPVHGANGLLGTVAVGLFASQGGLFMGGGPHLLGVQLLGAAAVAVWGFGVTYVAFAVLRALGILRVSADEERVGLDWALHGRHAYHHPGPAAAERVRPASAGHTLV
jgi:Amt family ammonium transporter